jgi:hypothetical protein
VQEQRSLKAGEITQQETQNMSASSMKLQTETFTAERVRLLHFFPFWNELLWVGRHQHGGSRLIVNADIHLPDYAVSHLRGLKSTEISGLLPDYMTLQPRSLYSTLTSGGVMPCSLVFTYQSSGSSFIQSIHWYLSTKL